MKKFTNIVTQDDQVSRYLVVVDENDQVIKKIISYNIDTKEAELFVIGEDGKAVTVPNAKNGIGYLLPKFSGDQEAGWTLKTEKKVLVGSKIRFKVIV